MSVELSNGCICCTLREDLLQETLRLAQEDRFDYLLIESTGISEPLPVAETWSRWSSRTCSCGGPRCPAPSGPRRPRCAPSWSAR
ncbi:GTP-binding protein [Stigmatella aurantiaca]|uniref:GTP-binding protein n=1 Tax=Stigmatella aurantiaca TaxID=41 RepID=UPI002481A820|nr:GTP-binding protein [Stigmatella aurantiaca]